VFKRWLQGPWVLAACEYKSDPINLSTLESLVPCPRQLMVNFQLTSKVSSSCQALQGFPEGVTYVLQHPPATTSLCCFRLPIVATCLLSLVLLSPVPSPLLCQPLACTAASALCCWGLGVDDGWCINTLHPGPQSTSSLQCRTKGGGPQCLSLCLSLIRGSSAGWLIQTSGLVSLILFSPLACFSPKDAHVALQWRNQCAVEKKKHKVAVLEIIIFFQPSGPLQILFSFSLNKLYFGVPLRLRPAPHPQLLLCFLVASNPTPFPPSLSD
jgi:hypothetical protein